MQCKMCNRIYGNNEFCSEYCRNRYKLENGKKCSTCNNSAKKNRTQCKVCIKKQKVKSLRIRTLNKRIVKQASKIRKLQYGNEFFDSREWQELRYRALIEYGRKCMCCGITKAEFHVDHIKPRSKYPELALDFSNLQILCRACNLGKSNKDETDFRCSSEKTENATEQLHYQQKKS